MKTVNKKISSDPIMMERLWNEHKQTITQAAKKFAYTHRITGGHTIDDIVMMGYEGLVKAVDTYDPDYGVPMGAWICMQCRGIWSGLCRSSDVLDQPSTVSMDAPIGSDTDDDDRTIGDTIQADIDIEDTTVRDLLMSGYMEQVREIMQTLPDRQRAVVESVYIDGMMLSDMGPHAPVDLQQGLRGIRRELVRRGLYHGGVRYEGI